MNAKTNSLPASVSIVVRILSGTDENLTGLAKSGQRKWWLQGQSTTGNPWHDIGALPGNAAGTFTADLVPGAKYIVGTGLSTRVRFVCPSVPCTMAVDPVRGTASVVSSAPVLTVVPNETPSDAPAYHVRNAPIGTPANGVTFSTMGAAFAALSELTGTHLDEIKSGRIAVILGRWPLAAYPPPAPPIVADIVGISADGTVAITPEPQWRSATRVPQPQGLTSADMTPFVATVDRLVSAVDVPVRPMDTDASYQAARIQADEQRRASVAPVVEVEVGGFAVTPPALVVGDATARGPLTRQPYAVDALLDVSMRVASEDRQDLQCDLTSVQMTPDGRLSLYGQSYGVESAGFGELITLRNARSSTLPRARAVMEILPPSIRADVWNAQNVASHSNADDGAVLRTRLHGAKRSAFAVVSRGYTSLDAGTIADITREALAQIPGGPRAKGTVSYNPGTTSLVVDVLFEGEVRARRGTRADDGHVGGVRITSADNGTGSIRASTLVWRLVCSNGMMGFGPGTSERIVHRGNRDSMVARLVDAITSTASQAQSVVDSFVALRETTIASLFVEPSTDTLANVRAVANLITGTVDETADLPVTMPDVDLPPMATEGIERDVLVEALLSAWGREPGDTLADIVNAVTRLHSERVPVPVLRAAEEYAGQLAYSWS